MMRFPIDGEIKFMATKPPTRKYLKCLSHFVATDPDPPHIQWFIHWKVLPFFAFVTGLLMGERLITITKSNNPSVGILDIPIPYSEVSQIDTFMLVPLSIVNYGLVGCRNACPCPHSQQSADVHSVVAGHILVLRIAANHGNAAIVSYVIKFVFLRARDLEKKQALPQMPYEKATCDENRYMLTPSDLASIWAICIN